MILATNGEASGKIFVELIHHEALLRLIRGLENYLSHLSNGVVTIENVTVLYPMTQALALLSKGNLSEQEKTMLGEFALKQNTKSLLQGLFSAFSVPEISFLSAGIMGNLTAVLSNTISPLLISNAVVNVQQPILANILSFQDANEQGLLDYVQMFFTQLSNHRNSTAAVQILGLLRLLLHAQVELRNDYPHVILQRNLTDASNSPLLGVLNSIQNYGEALSADMRDDIEYMCSQLNIQVFVVQENMRNVVPRNRNVNSILGRILKILLGFAFLTYYLASLYVCGRDMVAVFPLRPSWSGNSSSFISLSCVDRVTDNSCSSLEAKLQNVSEGRDVLNQQVHNLTAAINSLRDEYHTSNMSFEKQIQSLNNKISQQTCVVEKIPSSVEGERDPSSSLKLQEEIVSLLTNLQKSTLLVNSNKEVTNQATMPSSGRF